MVTVMHNYLLKELYKVINAAATDADLNNAKIKVIFKNYTPFTLWKSEINTQVANATWYIRRS